MALVGHGRLRIFPGGDGHGGRRGGGGGTFRSGLDCHMATAYNQRWLFAGWNDGKHKSQQDDYRTH